MRIKRSQLNKMIETLLNEKTQNFDKRLTRRRKEKNRATNTAQALDQAIDKKATAAKIEDEEITPEDMESYTRATTKRATTSKAKEGNPAYKIFLNIVSQSNLGINFVDKGQAGQNAYKMLKQVGLLVKMGSLTKASTELEQMLKFLQSAKFKNEDIVAIKEIKEIIELLETEEDKRNKSKDSKDRDQASASKSSSNQNSNQRETPKPSPEKTKLLIQQIQNNIGAPNTGKWDKNTQTKWESWITRDETIAKIFSIADSGVLLENKIIKENFIFESLKSRKLNLILETTDQEVYDAIFASKNDATKLAKILGYPGNIEGVADMVDDIYMEDIGDTSKGFDLAQYLEYQDFDIDMSSNKQDSTAASRSNDKQNKDNTDEKTKKPSSDQTKTKEPSDKSPKERGEIEYSEETIGWSLDSNKTDGVRLEIPSSLKRDITDNIKKRLKKQALFDEMERVVKQYSKSGDVERAKVLNVVRNKYNWNKTLMNRGMSKDDLDSLLEILKIYEKIRL